MAFYAGQVWKSEGSLKQDKNPMLVAFLDTQFFLLTSLSLQFKSPTKTPSNSLFHFYIKYIFRMFKTYVNYILTK